MRVQLTRFAGLLGNRALRAGEIVDVSEELANDMLSDGRAVPVSPARTVRLETTEDGPVENTAKRTGKVRR